MHLIQRTILLSIDCLGLGELPDSGQYNSLSANTLGHISEKIARLKIPNLSRLGIGNLTYIRNADRSPDTLGFYGKIRRQSDGIDAVSGAWEICGNKTESIFYSDPKGFFPEMIQKMEKLTGYKLLFNEEVNGPPLPRLMAHDHVEEKKPIIFYDENYAVSIVAHPEVMDADALNDFVHKSEEVWNYYGVSRVKTVCTADLSVQVFRKEKTTEHIIHKFRHSLLTALSSSNIPVYLIGNINLFFPPEEEYEIMETTSDSETMESLIQLLNRGIAEDKEYFVYASLNGLSNIATSGSVRDFADALEFIDAQLPRLYRAMNTSDILIITSSHSSDITVKQKGFTREYLPLLIYSRILNVRSRGNLGVRRTLSDISETISDIYSLGTHYGGDSFWNYMISRI